MYYLNYNNMKLFIEKSNKIILTDYIQYFNFLKVIKAIECNESKLEINGLKLNNKNTLIIDLSSISAMTEIFSDKNKIIEEYIKTKLEKMIINQEDEEKVNSIIMKYIEEIVYSNINNDINFDFIKTIKSFIKIRIRNEKELLDIIKEIQKNENIKHIIIIYKKDILNKFKLSEIEHFENDKIILFEVCDKESKIYLNDNILIFDKEITQIRVDDFYELILNKVKNFKNINREELEFLINKILFYSINRKEVDIIMKNSKYITELIRVFEEDLKINLTGTSDYI